MMKFWNTYKRTIKNNCNPTSIMKVVLLFIFFAPFLSISQEIGINHFERKINLSEIFLPSEEFSSEPYQISFPDSLYSYAKIELKKVILPNTKVSINFKAKDDHYTETKIKVKKGKKRDRLLSILEKKLGTSINEDKIQCISYNDSVLKIEFSSKR